MTTPTPFNKPQQKKLTSRQKNQLTQGRAIKPVFNLRTVIIWVIILSVIVFAFYVFFQRDNIIDAANNAEPTHETCEVTRMNTTREFDTSCGRLYWGEDVGMSPEGYVQVGHTYKFKVVGARLPLFGMKPTVLGYEEVK